MPDSSDAHAPKIKPYKYQEYPMMLHKAEGKTLVIKNEVQKKQAISKGWLLAPPQPLPSTEELELQEK
jgi:hypothetical protein